MTKINLCFLFIMTFVPSLVLSVVLRDSHLKPINNHRRVISRLYNKKGKPHDLGSDFGLTSDVYTKLNPFYTKNIKKSAEKKPEPVYYPVYNHSVTQDVASTSSDETFDTPPSSYDSKTNTYVSSSYAEPPNTYGSPSYSVQSVPSSSYGIPSSSSYGSGMSSYYPHPSYGPPPSYGAPTYYPPAPVMHQMPENQKSNSEWFLAKLMKKFDLILMSKILLKLIIFKKIVKFIGIICLLMFIPILKKKFEEHTGDGEDDEERRIKSLDAFANLDFRIKEVVNFAFTAIEGFSYDNIPWCVGESVFYCRFQYMLDSIDLRYPGSRIVSLWFPKLGTTTAATPTEASEKVEQFDERTVDFNDFITESSDIVTDESEDSNENKLNTFNSIFRR